MIFFQIPFFIIKCFEKEEQIEEWCKIFDAQYINRQKGKVTNKTNEPAHEIMVLIA